MAQLNPFTRAYRLLFPRRNEKRHRIYSVAENGMLVEVFKTRENLELWQSGGFYSTTDMWNGKELALPNEVWTLLSFFLQNPRILLIGLGGGSLCLYLDEIEQNYHMDAVDISSAVIEVSKKYFGIRESERLAIFKDDAAAFIAQNPARKYDLIILDAFSGKLVPEHLLTSEFLTALTTSLSEEGILTILLNSVRRLRTPMTSILSNLSNLRFTIFYLLGTNLVICFKKKMSISEFANKLDSLREEIPLRKDDVTRVAEFIEHSLIAVATT